MSFKIDRGETLGLLGPNGAGKTTAIRLSACSALLFSANVGALVLTYIIVGVPHSNYSMICPKTSVLFSFALVSGAQRFAEVLAERLGKMGLLDSSIEFRFGG